MPRDSGKYSTEKSLLKLQTRALRKKQSKELLMKGRDSWDE